MIEINDSRKISEIQEDFSTTFPFLKILFYTASEVGADPQVKFVQVKNLSKKIGEYRKTSAKAVYIISPDKSVTDLEQFFKVQYDLVVQVFRKSGKAWLETSATGNWPLGKQNNEGEQLSRPYNS